jgi:tau tubulin kinase
MSRLGSGGQGAVYEARDGESGLVVAVKVPRPDRGGKRIEREAQALEAIQHERVVRMLHASLDSTPPFIVMQRLGPTLSDLIRAAPRQRLSPRDAARIGLDALLALEACHRAGFVHRDVKPSNLATAAAADTGAVTLIDLGLAVRIDRPARKKQRFVGTARYASVAVLEGGAHAAVDDLIGLWLSLLHAVAGGLPWGREAKKEDVLRLGRKLMGRSLPRGLPVAMETMRRALMEAGTPRTAPYATMASSLGAMAVDVGGAGSEAIDWTTPGAPARTMREMMEGASAWRRGTDGARSAADLDGGEADSSVR